MIEDDNTATSAPTKAELLAVEIGDWAPLGGDVRLELAGRRTVLVGRNGSGKSALLDGIFVAGQIAEGISLAETKRRFGIKSDSLPGRFFCELTDARGERLHYQYRRRKQIEEAAWRPSQGERPSERTDVRALDRDTLTACFYEQNGVTAASLRHHFVRSRQVVTVEKTADGLECSYLNRDEPEIGDLAASIARHYFGGCREWVEELADLGRRMGAWQVFHVDSYRGPEGTDSLASVSIDGVDLGLVADGTLRMTDILWLLVSAARLPAKLVMIDEPETGIHPGLLAGLLDTIDAYSIDRQVIVSTHSPQVVSWAKPQELRVVTREAGKTQVRPLSEQQVAQFLKYLHDQTLGEYVYSGALDED